MPRSPAHPLFANYRILIRMPVLLYGVMCAYLSALPFSLSLSVYLLLLQYLGFGEEASGCCSRCGRSAVSAQGC